MASGFLSTENKIFLTGHKGLVGSSIFSKLIERGYKNIIVEEKQSLDLRNKDLVNEYIKKNQPDIVIICAAKVGGIMANYNSPIDFLNDNIQIQSNLINSSFANGISKLIFFGSSCIYPRNCSQPIKEESLLSGYLEKTNEAYALAKIVGLKLCNYYNSKENTSYRCLMPTNLYGENDNFDTELGHVIPSLIKKISNAKKNNQNLEVWGDGSAKREFLHSEDLAEASIFCMELSDELFFNNNKKLNSHINIGSGELVSIKTLVEKLTKIFNFNNKIIYNKKIPNGTPVKYLDSSKIMNLGWRPKITLDQGLNRTVKSFIDVR